MKKMSYAKIPNMNNFFLRLEFEHKGMRDQIIGFRGKLERKDIENWTDIQEALQSRDRQNPFWVYHIDFDKCRTLYSPESIKKIMNGEMAEIYISKIEVMLKMVEDLEM